MTALFDEAKLQSACQLVWLRSFRTIDAELVKVLSRVPMPRSDFP